ncbi:MAG TPA: septum formation initiator family protein [Pyrinomonadaceae bacterium]|nr:septum formation initiator family protein [Pyrinomonadaceae bacterium]
MNKAANTYWVDDRLRAQRVAARALPSLAPARELSREIIGTRTEVRRRGGIIPAWVVFGMIILATFAMCATITMRTRAEMATASQQHARLSADVEALRHTNSALGREVGRLRSDPRTIETAARTRLNMVRSDEIVVPVE